MDAQKIIRQINTLLREAECNSNNAAAGYDEGWYCGEANAYEIVLQLLKEEED